jgi:hypothetical protein
MSLAAPWIAACIHSACVFHSGIRFYNAEIGGSYFHGYVSSFEQPSFWKALTWIGACGTPGLITFLILLPFRKHTLLRWTLWICCIILWTGVLFQMEVAFK